MKESALVSNYTVAQYKIHSRGCNESKVSNIEVIGYSAAPNKDASLIEKALLRCRYPLKDIKVFHSDRGNEYDNMIIDDILSTFKINRSLSRKGNPYDNAVSEATNKSLKIEFIYQNKFESLGQLQLELAEHIYWYNNIRIHESLDYMTPVEYRELNTMKLGKAS